MRDDEHLLISYYFNYSVKLCFSYIAPEQYSQIYDRPADVWSFGVVIARLLGVQDWKSFNHLKLPRIEEFKLKDQFLIELCFSCLEPEPMMRPTFDQIVR